MSGEHHRRPGSAGADAAPLDGVPDPFEDIAAPPLRVGPPPVRPKLVAPRPAGPAPATADFPVPEAASAAPRAAPDPAVLEIPAADDPLHRPFELTSLSGSDWTPPEAPPKPALAPAARAPAAAVAPRASGLRQLRVAVAVGLVLAAGIVALAVAFRPSADLAATPEVAPADAPTALGSGPVPAPAPGRGVAATPAAAASVTLRVEAGVPQGRREALEAAILAAGYAGVAAGPVGAGVERGRIEYFHAADRDAAEGLARSLAPLTGQPLGVHDMSAVTLDAAPGRLDVWIAD